MAAIFIDYYETLGLAKTATKDEIKTAYRNAARKHHPDLHPKSEKAESEEKFKQINEAYEVLSDAEKRTKYDRFGENWRNGQAQQPTPDNNERQYSNWDGQNDSSFSDFFDSLFGGGRASGSNGGFGHQRNARGQDLDSELELTLEEAYLGGQKSFQFSLKGICPTCSGTGAVNQRICLSCGGTGYKTTDKTLDVKIPKGLKNGSKIRLKGQGGEGKGDGKPGDLLLIIMLLPHTVFTLKGSDIEVTAKIRPEQAVLGDKVFVPTIDGTVKITVPPLSQTGRKLRIRSKGWPQKDGSRGDQYVEIRIVIPTSLSKEELLLYQNLLDLEKEVLE